MNLLLEGNDLEALLLRAHREGGTSARIVRAEKVRRGGVLGFFAREGFEVAVEIPRGAESGRDDAEFVRDDAEFSRDDVEPGSGGPVRSAVEPEDASVPVSDRIFALGLDRAAAAFDRPSPADASFDRPGALPAGPASGSHDVPAGSVGGSMGSADVPLSVPSGSRPMSLLDLAERTSVAERAAARAIALQAAYATSTAPPTVTMPTLPAPTVPAPPLETVPPAPTMTEPPKETVPPVPTVAGPPPPSPATPADQLAQDQLEAGQFARDQLAQDQFASSPEPASEPAKVTFAPIEFPPVEFPEDRPWPAQADPFGPGWSIDDLPLNDVGFATDIPEVTDLPAVPEAAGSPAADDTRAPVVGSDAEMWFNTAPAMPPAPRPDADAPVSGRPPFTQLMDQLRGSVRLGRHHPGPASKDLVPDGERVPAQGAFTNHMDDEPGAGSGELPDLADLADIADLAQCHPGETEPGSAPIHHSMPERPRARRSASAADRVRRPAVASWPEAGPAAAHQPAPTSWSEPEPTPDHSAPNSWPDTEPATHQPASASWIEPAPTVHQPAPASRPAPESAARQPARTSPPETQAASKRPAATRAENPESGTSEAAPRVRTGAARATTVVPRTSKQRRGSAGQSLPAPRLSAHDQTGADAVDTSDRFQADQRAPRSDDTGERSAGTHTGGPRGYDDPAGARSSSDAAWRLLRGWRPGGRRQVAFDDDYAAAGPPVVSPAVPGTFPPDVLPPAGFVPDNRVSDTFVPGARVSDTFVSGARVSDTFDSGARVVDTFAPAAPERPFLEAAIHGEVPAASSVIGSSAQLAADRESLRALGVPASWTRHLDEGDRFTSVVSMLSRLPELNISDDVAVIAVIGPADVVELEAHRTALDLPVEGRPRAVAVLPEEPGVERRTAIARSKRIRPVVISIPIDGYDDPAGTRKILSSVQAEAVIAVVDAGRTLEEITRWIEALERVDAIALDGALDVESPAAVLGLDVPVIRVDGIAVDRIGWAALLCAQLSAMESPR